MLRSSTVRLAMLAGLLAAADPAPAAVFNVASGDVAGLAGAISAANGNGEADTIVLAAGTYSATSCCSPPASNTAFPVITSEITIVGAGAATTRIERAALPVFRLLSVAATGKLHLQDLTLADGGGTTISFDGGAVSSAGDLTVTNCTFTGNVAESGGAIAATARLTIEGSTFTGNSARFGAAVSHRGGAGLTIRGSTLTANDTGATVDLFASGVVEIADTAIDGNAELGLSVATGVTSPVVLTVVRSSLSGNGSGVAVFGQFAGWMRAFLTDSTIAGNGGSGVTVGDAELTIRRSTISGNTTTGAGGGILVLGADQAPGGLADVTIESSTISGNSAQLSGGGISLDSNLRLGRRIRLRNSTVTGNHADSDLNATGDGGGIASSFPVIEIENTIVGDNSTGPAHPSDCIGTLLSNGSNLLGVTSGCTMSARASDHVGVAPQLGPLAANGGPTLTHLPLPGSPAIDAGNHHACPDRDQRGRVRSVAVTCDIGAVEAASATSVVALSDHFLCYGAKTSTGTAALPALSGVSLADPLSAGSFAIDKTAALCLPASKNGEGTIDAATHLQARGARSGAAVSPLPLRIVNQLGAATVVPVKAERLLLPASKGIGGALPPPDPMTHDLDAYTCYKARTAPGTPKLPRGTATLQVSLDDQFGTGRVVQLSAVSRLCVATDVAGAGRKHPDAYLLCYKARAEKPSPSPVSIVKNLYASSAWGTEQVDTGKQLEVCVPSTSLP